MASDGTFDMVADKRNILAVPDKNKRVRDNLMKRDSLYPTAEN